MARVVAIFSVSLFISIVTLASASTADPAFREIYAEGRKYMQEEKWAKALDIFKSLEKDYLLLGDYVLLDMAACYEKSGDMGSAEASLRKLLISYKKSTLYRKAYRKILAIAKNRDIEAALVSYDLYLKEFPQDSAALWEKAEIFEKLDRKDEAFAIWKELFFSGSSYALKARELLKTRDYQPTYEEIKKVMPLLLEKENYRQAAALLEGIALRDEEGKYLLGRTYFRLRRYRDAIKVLTGISLKEGQTLLAQNLIRAREKEAFYRLLAELAKEGRKDLLGLHLTAAEFKRREGHITEAAAILQSLPALYPEKKEEIVWSQVWLAVRQKNLSAAEKLLTGLASSNSEKRDKYLFWLGKVKNYQGRPGDDLYAQIKDRNSYYWFKAGKGEPGQPSEGRGPSLKTTEEAPLVPEETNAGFMRIRDLNSLKMKAEARAEAQAMIGSVTDRYLPAFALLLANIEDYATLVKLGIRYNYASLKYPLAFRETVSKYARAQKLDPLLVIAIMREESHFRYDAVSSAGALGIMQLMPATARSLGDVKKNEDLFDAEKNIKLGTNYLSKLMARFKSPYHAIAAYNAGEHNVERWLAAGYLDEDDFTEDIPFNETKNYVFKVMKTYSILKNLYGNEGAY
jgi:soluble lytic murein transglycosylase